MGKMPLVKKTREVGEEPVPKSHLSTIKVIFGQGDGMPNFYMRIFTMEPGGWIPKHVHDSIEHEQLMLHGEMSLTLNDQERTVRAGDAVFIPAGVAHAYRNTGEETVRFMCAVPAVESYQTNFID